MSLVPHLTYGPLAVANGVWRRNLNGLQMNKLARAFLRGKVEERLALGPIQEVIWLDTAVLKSRFKNKMAYEWGKGKYAGGGAKTLGPSSYELEIAQKVPQLVLGEVKQLIVAERTIGVGVFQMLANGDVKFFATKSKGYVTFVSFYLGQDKGVISRIKSSHQEKWERVCETLNSDAKKIVLVQVAAFNKAYAFYRQVLDLCASHAYESRLNS